MTKKNGERTWLHVVPCFRARICVKSTAPLFHREGLPQTIAAALPQGQSLNMVFPAFTNIYEILTTEAIKIIAGE